MFKKAHNFFLAQKSSLFKGRNTNHSAQETQKSDRTQQEKKQGNHRAKYSHILRLNKERWGSSAKDTRGNTSKLSSRELVTPDPSYGEEEYEAQQIDYGHIGNRAVSKEK